MRIGLLLREAGLWIAHGLLALLMASTLGGCAFWEKAQQYVPAVEACFYTKYGKVCAVKVDGKWMIRADLGPEERAEAEAEINRREDGP